MLAPDGVFACTFSNRCFPTKAIRGWLSVDEVWRAGIVGEYFRRAGGFSEPVATRRPTPPGGDPLLGVHALRARE